MKGIRIFASSLILAIFVTALTACGGTETTALTFTSAPISTAVHTTPFALPPTTELTGDISKVLEAPAGYEPSNIPDFYPERSNILALRENGGEVSVILISSDEAGDHLIVELVRYPAIAFFDEIDRFREQGLEAAAKWRPSARYIPFIAWSLFSEIKDGMVPTYIYKRAEGEELVYIGTDTLPIASLSGDAVEVSILFFEAFNEYIDKYEEPQQLPGE